MRSVEERVCTSYGDHRVLMMGETSVLPHLPHLAASQEVEVRAVRLTTRLRCLHQVLVQLEDQWTASYLCAAAQALHCLSEDLQCSVELTRQQASLSCSLFSLEPPSLHCVGGGLAGLREAIENHQDNELTEVVAALQRVNIPPEDILRVLTAVRLLSSCEADTENLQTNQRMTVMRDSAELLGVSQDLLTKIINENQNIAGLGSLSARLSGFLTARTIQSIVKKVNRTIKRRFALQMLCSASPDRQAVSPTTIRMVNHPVTKVLAVSTPWLPPAVMEMFQDNSHSQFGFASHLFQPDCDSVISPDWSPPCTAPPILFCLDSVSSLVSQVRELSLLELVVTGQGDSLWRCYTTHQFSSRFRVLASSTCQDEADTVFSVLDLVADCDEVEICQEAGTVMLGLPAQHRLEDQLEERRQESARRIQAWWRQRRDSLAESHLIQTVLIKYETLQRQSQSLVYSFADRTIR